MPKAERPAEAGHPSTLEREARADTTAGAGTGAAGGAELATARRKRALTLAAAEVAEAAQDPATPARVWHRLRDAGQMIELAWVPGFGGDPWGSYGHDRARQARQAIRRARPQVGRLASAHLRVALAHIAVAEAA